MDINELRKLRNWSLLRDNRELLNKYLDIMSTNPNEIDKPSPLVYKLYDTISQEDMVRWEILLDQLQKLFHNEQGEVQNILAGKTKWES